MNAGFTAFNAGVQTDSLSSNYELCPGISVAVGEEKLNPTKKESAHLLCSCSPDVFGPPPLLPLSFSVASYTSLRTGVA